MRRTDEGARTARGWIAVLVALAGLALGALPAGAAVAPAGRPGCKPGAIGVTLAKRHLGCLRVRAALPRPTGATGLARELEQSAVLTPLAGRLARPRGRDARIPALLRTRVVRRAWERSQAGARRSLERLPAAADRELVPLPNGWSAGMTFSTYTPGEGRVGGGGGSTGKAVHTGGLLVSYSTSTFRTASACPTADGVVVGAVGRTSGESYALPFVVGGSSFVMRVTVDSVTSGRITGHVGDDARLARFDLSLSVRTVLHAPGLPPGAMPVGSGAYTTTLELKDVRPTDSFDAVLGDAAPELGLTWPSGARRTVAASRDGTVAMTAEGSLLVWTALVYLRSAFEDAQRVLREAEAVYYDAAGCVRVVSSPDDPPLAAGASTTVGTSLVRQTTGAPVAALLAVSSFGGAAATPQSARTTVDTPAGLRVTAPARRWTEPAGYTVTATSKQGRATTSVVLAFVDPMPFHYRVRAATLTLTVHRRDVSGTCITEGTATYTGTLHPPASPPLFDGILDRNAVSFVRATIDLHGTGTSSYGCDPVPSCTHADAVDRSATMVLHLLPTDGPRLRAWWELPAMPVGSLDDCGRQDEVERLIPGGSDTYYGAEYDLGPFELPRLTVTAQRVDATYERTLGARLQTGTITYTVSLDLERVDELGAPVG